VFDKPFLMETEAADLLRVRPSTLQNWRVLGGGPPFLRLGGIKRGRIIYDREALIAWARARERTCTTDTIGVA
jgi:hypothetical protein